MKKKISDKQRITLTINNNTYLQLKMQQINVSELAEQLFQGYLNLEPKQEDKDIIQLEEELEKQQKQFERIKIKLSQLKIRLANAKKDKEELGQKELNELVKTADSLAAANWLNDSGGGAL